MAKEQYILKLAMLEQEMNKLEQQMQLIEQQVLEMQNLKNSLEELERSKEKELLANLGKNIFIKTEIKNKNLLVDVGNKTFIKKNIEETLKVIEDQTGKLMEAKSRIIEKMREFQQETEKVIGEAEKAK